MGTGLKSVLPRPTRSSRWIVGAALGIVLVVSTACSSGGASTPKSTNPGGVTPAAKTAPAKTPTTKATGGYGY
jgi:hypothetical protein